MAPRLLALLAAVFALALAASASAGGPKRAAAKLATCDTVAHSATFVGDMRAFGRATGLQMRFTLQTRSETAREWTRVDAPNFDIWLSAAPGKLRYVYDKQVENLPVGAAYRAVVRFRWRAGNRIVARAIRRTPACRQPDERANLKAVRIKVAPGSTPSSRTYEVRVTNEGDTETPAFAVGLEVNGERLGVQHDPGLVEGDENEIIFEAARCEPGSPLVATVDVAGAVDESDETDNVLTVPCPPGAKRGRGRPLESMV